jgi:deoxyribodipyrimidine photo-lyase
VVIIPASLTHRAPRRAASVGHVRASEQDTRTQGDAMASRKVEEGRLKRLNEHAAKGGEYVLYWMQQSTRAEHNPALEYAIQQANAAKLPLLVGYGLMDDYPEANVRHYRFLLEGLQDCQRALAARSIPFALQRGAPPEVAVKLARHAALVVCDRGYLRHQKQWRQHVAQKAPCPVVQVEADVVVPVDVASGKAEYAARTLRPKIHRLWETYLVKLAPTPLKVDSLKLGVKGLDLEDVDAVLKKLVLDRSVPPVHHRFRGGTREANRLLRADQPGGDRARGSGGSGAAAAAGHVPGRTHRPEGAGAELRRVHAPVRFLCLPSGLGAQDFGGPCGR